MSAAWSAEALEHIDVATELEIAVRGADGGSLRADVDAAYRAKYGGGVDAMVNDRAAATTLRLRPA